MIHPARNHKPQTSLIRDNANVSQPSRVVGEYNTNAALTMPATGRLPGRSTKRLPKYLPK
jgi:hypothetical protein